MSLKNTTVSGVKWSGISQVGRQVLQIITVTVLARLLLPSDFGLVGMATIVTGFAMLFSDLGTAAAIVQRQDSSDHFLSSIFWVNVSFGTLVGIVLFAIAPFIALFYQEPRVQPLLQLLSVTFFVAGVGIVHKSLLQRNLQFYMLAKIELAASFFGSVVAISSALFGGGAWSLVYLSLVTMLVTTLLLWNTSQWKPSRLFDWSLVKSSLQYSLNLTGFNIFNYFSRNADYILVGRYLGAEPLGYYTLAYRLMLYPLQQISGVIGHVMFPTLSKIQHDHARFRRIYLQVNGVIAFITFPMMLGLMGLAYDFVHVAFGTHWLTVAPLLVILAPVGLAQSIGSTVGIIYQAVGRTDWLFKWGIGSGLIIVSSFVIGLQWGIIGVATAYTLVTFIIAYPSFAIPFKLIDLPVRDLVQVLWRPFMSSLVMLIGILGLQLTLLSDMASLFVLLITIPTGIVIYIIMSWVINREQLRELFEIARIALWKPKQSQKSQA